MMSSWRSFPGTAIGNGIAEVLDTVVGKVGLIELCLQSTSLVAVPGSRTWFSEHTVQFLQEPSG